MKTLRDTTWYVRAALVLVAVWAVWLLAFVVWALTLPELKSGDAAHTYAVDAAAIFVVVVLGLGLAVWRPDSGAIGSGLLITLLAGGQGGGHGVDGLAHWGDVMLGGQGRTTPWVPLDSIAGVPYWVLLAAGALLVVGGAAHLRYPMSGYVRAGCLLVAVWGVWLTAFTGWVGSTKELQHENVYMGYTVFVWFLMLPVVASLVLVAIAWPRWGAISGGLGLTLVAAFWCRFSVNALRDWGQLTIVDSSDFRDRPWVVLDSIGTLPYWVLLAAGVLLVVGGVVHVVHPTHRSTPHAGLAA